MAGSSQALARGFVGARFASPPRHALSVALEARLADGRLRGRLAAVFVARPVVDLSSSATIAQSLPSRPDAPPVAARLDSGARPRCISPVLGRWRAPTSWRSPIAPASPDSHTLHALGADPQDVPSCPAATGREQRSGWGYRERNREVLTRRVSHSRRCPEMSARRPKMCRSSRQVRRQLARRSPIRAPTRCARCCHART